MKFIDLFCGIGGFRLALEKDGHECVFSSDIDRQCRKVYQLNFDETPEGDITKIPVSSIPSHDILCAGFPCQAFSVAGARRGFDDTRGTLFFEIMRIVDHHRPAILILENVKGFLNHDNGRTMQIVWKHLENLDYRIEGSLLNSSYFGYAQSRERIYIVGIRKDVNLYWNRPHETYENVCLNDILESEEEVNKKSDEIHLSMRYVKNGWKRFDHTEYKETFLKLLLIGKFENVKFKMSERIYHPQGHSPTLTVSGDPTHIFWINNRLRGLTLVECKRLMGYADDHKISSGLRGYIQLGNSVIPEMISHVYRGIQPQTKGLNYEF